MSDLTAPVEIKVSLCKFCNQPCLSEAELKLHISSEHEKDNLTTPDPEPSTTQRCVLSVSFPVDLLLRQ